MKARAEFRLWQTRLWSAVARRVAEMDARMEAGPEGAQAEMLGWLRQGGYRLARFRAANGRLPAKDEMHLVLPP